MELELIRKEAQDLSNYDGNEYRETYAQADGDDLVGASDDDLVGFAGGVDSRNMSAVYGNEDWKRTDRRITIILENADTTNSAKIYLCPGSLAQSANGVLKTGSVTGAGGTGTITASTPDGDLDMFAREFQDAPTQLLGMVVQSTNPAQFSQVLEVFKKSTFVLTSAPVATIRFTKKSEFVNQSDIVTVTQSMPLMFDRKTFAALIIPKATSSTIPTVTTIELYFGAHIDVADTLKKRSDKKFATPMQQLVKKAKQRVNGRR